MTDAYFYPRFTENEGWEQDATHASPQTYKSEYFGGADVEVDRYFITRIVDIDIPAGATITAAYMNYYVYAKFDADVQGFTYDFKYEVKSAGGTTVLQDSAPLRTGVYESSSANRAWSSTFVSGGTFNWNTTAGDNQLLQIDVTSRVQQAINTNAGRHMNMAFMLKILSETGTMGINNNAGGAKQRLLIQYTGGTPRNEVVNVNENPNFMQISGNVPATGLPANWINNSVYATYQPNPTYLVQSSHAGIPAAPGGGKILKVTSTVDNARAVAFHLPANDLAWGEWYCFSAYVYVPTGVPDLKPVSLDSLYSDQGRVSVKDAWVRLYVACLTSPDSDLLLGIGTIDPQMMTGQSFYVANVNFTKGRQLYPYFDGNSPDTATYHRTFDWGGGTIGKTDGGISYAVLDNKPSAVPDSTQATASIYKGVYGVWTYTDPYNEPSQAFSVELRKKRVP